MGERKEGTMKKFEPKAGDLVLAKNGHLPCNGCDALTKLDDLREGCYCPACAEEIEVTP
jgi:hypothetical protein